MKNFTLPLLASMALIPCTLQAQVTFTNQTSLMPTQGIESSHPIAILDINGDDKDDLALLHDGSELYIMFQNAAGAMFTEYDHAGGGGGGWGGGAWGMCGGDVDNDGYADILYGGAYDDLTMVVTSTVETDYTDYDLNENLFLQGVNFADIDNDGNLDIFACDDDGPGRIYLGDGAGGFAQNTAIIDTELNGGGEDDSGNYGSLFTDIDNDGDIDLYIAKCRQGVVDPNDSRRINLLFVNNGNNTYTEMAGSYGINSGEQSWSADFGDIDNDGDMDLLLGQHTGEYVQIYENDGMGSFTDVTTAAGLDGSFPAHVIQSKFADFDNDGYIDILISGVNQWLFYMNNGDGTFDYSTQPNIGCEINSFALGDLNSDGFMDLYATPFGYGAWSPSGGDSIYFNDGNSNNWATVTLEGTISNPDAVGARVSIYGPWGVQMREVRSGESYGIQNTFNLHFGLGTATSIDSTVIHWPAGGVETHYNTPINDITTYIEGSLISTNDLDAEALNVTAFPNPARDQIMISIEGDIANKNLDLVIYDVTGNVVRQENNLTLNNVIVNRNGLANGLYFFDIRSSEGVAHSGKIIFQ